LNTPFIYRLISILQIPDNTIVGILPENISFNQADFGFSQQYIHKANEIILTCEITANKRSFSGDEINRFREMLVALNKAYKKSIVLTKI